MSKSNKNLLISELKEVIEELKNQVTDSSFIHCRKEFYNYLYLLKNNIVDVIPSLRDTLKELFQLQTYSGKQIIGDSAAFSEEANKFLLNNLAELKKFEGVIFYGFTGEGANGVVAELIEKKILSTEKIIANIVANESLAVIEKYQCRYSEKIQNFLIVDDGNGGCQFGDDINLSDPLAEKLICLEGGVISFGQVLNTLIHHEEPHIIIYTGLRKKDITGLERTLFSASELFLTLQQAKQNNRLDNSDQFESILTDYLKYHRLNPHNNDDNELKQKQIHAYFEKFKQLEKTTQQHIMDKIKSIQSINYSPDLFHEKKLNNCNFLTAQPSCAQTKDFLKTHKKRNCLLLDNTITNKRHMKNQASKTQFFLTNVQKVSIQSDVVPCESLKNH